MKALSRIVKINKIDNLSTEYIETELKKAGYSPLRWAIVKVEENQLSISVTSLQ